MSGRPCVKCREPARWGSVCDGCRAESNRANERQRGAHRRQRPVENRGGSVRGGEQLDARTFADWLTARIAAYEGELQREAALAGDANLKVTGAHQRLADELGITTRTLYRYARQLDGMNNFSDVCWRAAIEQMLDAAGVPLWEVYPHLTNEAGDVHDRWCPTCSEQSTTGADLICPWCETETVASAPSGKRRGKPAGKWGKLSDKQLRALHIVYERDGLSANAIAKRIWQNAGFKSHGSCATSLGAGWKRLGLPRRDRIEATVAASTIHGLAPKHGPRPGYGTYKRRLQQPDQPRCEGIKTQAPGKGRRCEHRAMFGSKFCASHDPARTLARQAHLANIRRRLVEAEKLPMEPFAAWLRELGHQHGSLHAAAEGIGLPRSAIYRYSKGLGTNGVAKDTITRPTVERFARAAGTTVDHIYAERLAA